MDSSSELEKTSLKLTNPPKNLAAAAGINTKATYTLQTKENGLHNFFLEFRRFLEFSFIYAEMGRHLFSEKLNKISAFFFFIMRTS